MRTCRFTEEQIVSILKQHEASARVVHLGRRHGVSEHTIYRWKHTYGGLASSAVQRLKLVAAEGESLPGRVPEIGNSQHRIRFDDDLRGWFEAWCATGPTHHVALGLGHRIGDIEKAAWLLGLQLDVVR
jgi:L-arabinose isomerase